MVERHIDFEPFAQRGLTPIRIKIEELYDAAITNNARGILLAPPPGKYGLIYSYFEERFHERLQIGHVDGDIRNRENRSG